MILEKGHQWMGSILTQDASVQATQVSHIYTFVAMIITAIIIVITKTITTIYWLYHKAYQCMHHKLQHSEIISKYSTTKNTLYFCICLPYLMTCTVLPGLFFDPVRLWHSDYSPRLVLDSAAWRRSPPPSLFEFEILSRTVNESDGS